MGDWLRTANQTLPLNLNDLKSNLSGIYLMTAP
jgi:hypothetical protein